jgi:hypothetical protein
MKSSKAAYINRLSDARVRLARQIDVLLSRSGDYDINREPEIGELIKKLRDVLRELEECIAAVWHEEPN